MGSSHHDAIKVPFILLPNAQNEGQFAFNIQEIKVPQKLKGTLTYIVKVLVYDIYELIKNVFLLSICQIHNLMKILPGYFELCSSLFNTLHFYYVDG